MSGQRPGGLPTQGEKLACLLEQAGYSTITVSGRSNRFARLFEILWTLWHKRDCIGLQVLQVFGGLSFVVEDLASLLSRALHQPIIMILRGGAMPLFARKYPIWTRQVLRRASVIVAPSAYLARELAWLGVPIRVIPNVVNLSEYPFKLRRHLQPHLLWMRTFYWTYRPEMAVRVLARLLPHFPNARLTLAGPDGGSLTEVKKMVSDLNLGNYVSFPGFLDLPAKIKLARQHDLYLTTNIMDNVPISVIEMAAMGLPVISTNGGGMPDMLTQEVDSLLVPNDNDQVMAEAVIRLLQDQELAARLSQNGRWMAERYSWEKVGPLWYALITETIHVPIQKERL
jgi:glycosyltransferase involved in cell wall biosynthesis